MNTICNNKSRLIIIGARALGRKACNYARDAGFEVVGFLDDKPDALDGYKGYPRILGSVENWTVNPDESFVCAIGNSIQREKYAQIIESKQGSFVSVIHPTAYIGPNVRIGAGCIICPQAVVDCDLKLGKHVVVNVHAFVAHDCILEDCVTLSPNVHLGGRTVLRKDSFLGIGATVIPDIEIGKESIVAAGAVVTQNVPSNVLVAGVPAVIKKKLNIRL